MTYGGFARLDGGIARLDGGIDDDSRFSLSILILGENMEIT